jgi:hypothetical protein
LQYSLADVWLKNSFNKLKIVSTITPWIQIDQTEKETSGYANGGTPINVGVASNAMIKALNVLSSRSNLNYLSMCIANAFASWLCAP